VSTPAPHPATPAEEGTQVGVTVAATGWRAYAKLAAYLVCVMAATAAPLADGDGGSVVEWLQVCSAGIAAAGDRGVGHPQPHQGRGECAGHRPTRAGRTQRAATRRRLTRKRERPPGGGPGGRRSLVERAPDPARARHHPF
jgi:hypothetical protein